MNIKKYISLILIWLNFFYYLNAQTEIVGHEKYKLYEQFLYIDNLDQRLIPKIINEKYYSNFKTSDFKVVSQVIDTFLQKREIFTISKKAKVGYLFINKCIMDKIASLNCDWDKIELVYVYNNRIVMTKNDVTKILNIKKKKVELSLILQDEQLGILFIYLFDKSL